MWGTDRLGQWIMGGIALVWLFDRFVAMYLTTPRRRSISTSIRTGRDDAAPSPGRLVATPFFAAHSSIKRFHRAAASDSSIVRPGHRPCAGSPARSEPKRCPS